MKNPMENWEEVLSNSAHLSDYHLLRGPKCDETCDCEPHLRDRHWVTVDDLRARAKRKEQARRELEENPDPAYWESVADSGECIPAHRLDGQMCWCCCA